MNIHESCIGLLVVYMFGNWMHDGLNLG